jgi:5'-methylthioadenosine phosphorylase
MLAIIGGTGLYELAGMEIEQHVEEPTPFGDASGAVLRGRVNDTPVLFLSRHGSGHRLLPHEVNYRANVFALKRAGATQILGFSAVGSLVERIAPGQFAVPNQYFDWTKGLRQGTFFGDGVAAHVSTAQPVSTNMIDWIAKAAAAHDMPLHRDVTYACVEGPRLGTRAESLFLQRSDCHLVGMTNVPEVFLAREAQICYATIGIVTDYDCWLDDPAQHVTVSKVFELYRQSLDRARALLEVLLASPPPAEEPEIRRALQSSLITPEGSLCASQREWLQVLRR